MKFSVVIPTFNSERYIATALESLVSQKHDDIEIIVIDGASQDGTLGILDDYSEFIDVLISEPDEGQSDAFNKGFSLARGDFFLWLNSDDALVPGVLNQAENYLLHNPECKWLTFNTIFIDKESNISFFNNGPSWSDLRMKAFGPQVDCPTSIFHKDLFLNADGFDKNLNYAMDIDLWYQFLGMGYSWHRLNYYGYAFRMHESSKTGSEGYGARPSNEKIVQSKLIINKHKICVPWWGGLVVKLDKLIFKKPLDWKNTYKWRGKPLCEFQP